MLYHVTDNIEKLYVPCTTGGCDTVNFLTNAMYSRYLEIFHKSGAGKCEQIFDNVTKLYNNDKWENFVNVILQERGIAHIDGTNFVLGFNDNTQTEYQGCSGNYTGGDAMPESVTDRCTRAHEYIFLLSKSQRYYFDTEAIREPIRESYTEKKRSYSISWQGHYKNSEHIEEAMAELDDSKIHVSPKRSGIHNRRSVWVINKQPFRGLHFATFPPALVEPCIRAGTSEYGCCPECGAPWERVLETVAIVGGGRSQKRADTPGAIVSPTSVFRTGKISLKKTVGWRPTCTCGIEETVPCTVLDPFGGSGTTTIVAELLGRNSVYIDINPEYVEMAKQRLETLKKGMLKIKLDSLKN